MMALRHTNTDTDTHKHTIDTPIEMDAHFLLAHFSFQQVSLPKLKRNLIGAVKYCRLSPRLPHHS